MTGTDLCVNKCKQSRSYLKHPVPAEATYKFYSAKVEIVMWKELICFQITTGKSCCL